MRQGCSHPKTRYESSSAIQVTGRQRNNNTTKITLPLPAELRSLPPVGERGAGFPLIEDLPAWYRVPTATGCTGIARLQGDFARIRTDTTKRGNFSGITSNNARSQADLNAMEDRTTSLAASAGLPLLSRSYASFLFIRERLGGSGGREMKQGTIWT